MNIRASISWNPEVEFEQLDLVNIVLSFENGEPQEFRGQLKRADTAIDYLGAIAYYASNESVFKVGEPIEQSDGRKVYDIPLSPKANLETVKYYSERIQKKHYISSRDEWVTDEQYCKFFGSSGNLWNIERCDYPTGDFAESLRQTVYDMENGSPGTYRWTNVPQMLLLEDRMEADPEFAKFAEKEIIPLVRAYWDGGAKKPDDVDGTIKQFNAIAELAERYKREHSIDRL